MGLSNWLTEWYIREWENKSFSKQLIAAFKLALIIMSPFISAFIICGSIILFSMNGLF